jgi:hypothetical protein
MKPSANRPGSGLGRAASPVIDRGQLGTGTTAPHNFRQRSPSNASFASDPLSLKLALRRVMGE